MASPWQRKVHHLSGPATVCSHSQPCHIDEGAVAVAGQCQKVRWPSQRDRSMTSDCIGKASPLLSPRVLPIEHCAERRINHLMTSHSHKQQTPWSVLQDGQQMTLPRQSVDPPSDARSRRTRPNQAPSRVIETALGTSRPDCGSSVLRRTQEERQKCTSLHVLIHDHVQHRSNWR